jgi:hypothetical protein
MGDPPLPGMSIDRIDNDGDVYTARQETFATYLMILLRT